jgi:hypothetical protein
MGSPESQSGWKEQEDHHQDHEADHQKAEGEGADQQSDLALAFA